MARRESDLHPGSYLNVEMKGNNMLVSVFIEEKPLISVEFSNAQSGQSHIFKALKKLEAAMEMDKIVVEGIYFSLIEIGVLDSSEVYKGIMSPNLKKGTFITVEKVSENFVFYKFYNEDDEEFTGYCKTENFFECFSKV